MKYKDMAFFIEVAKLAAAQSYGQRLKVGGCVVDTEGNFIAHGYNGDIRGGSNSLEHKYYPSDDAKNGINVNDQTYPYFDDFLCKPYRLVTKDTVIHSEMNIIAHAARRGISINNGTIFLTHSPCMHCCSMLIQTGLKEIVFIDKFRTYDEVYTEYKDYIKFTQWDSENV